MAATLRSTLFPRLRMASKSVFLPTLPIQFQTRDFKGSRRYKRLKAKKDKLRLESELEAKYGITSKQVFSVHNFMKQNYFFEIKAFQERLGINFNSSGLLMSAFAHSTFLKELELCVEPAAKKEEEIAKESDDEYYLRKRFDIKKSVVNISSEKLALLGFEHTVLTIKSSLYKKYHNMSPKICDNLVMFLVSREVINEVAKNLSMVDFILTSRELETTEDIDKEPHLDFTQMDIISDAFFAVIGAIYKDLGADIATGFIEDFLLVLLNHDDVTLHINMDDPKQELKNILSMNGIKDDVEARTIAESGVETDFPFYYVGVYCNGHKIGEGSGYSAQTGKTDAFKNTVFKLLDNEVDLTPLLDNEVDLTPLLDNEVDLRPLKELNQQNMSL